MTSEAFLNWTTIGIVIGGFLAFALSITCLLYTSPVELVDEQLRHTFVHQLVDTLGKLFLLHRVGILNVLEHLRRERCV